MIYNPLSSVRFTPIDDLEWADGSAEVPSDLRETKFSCAFPDGEEEQSALGLLLIF
jgi:hypothetical protein